MNISIYTPSHNAKYLLALYNSIKDQEFYEWVIVTNGKLKPRLVPEPIRLDVRVKIVPFEGEHNDWVGALKSFAVEQCTGELLLEVDHDDILTSDALSVLNRAAEENPECGFFYSNTANFTGDFEATEPYSEAYGWQHRDFEYNGHILHEAMSFGTHPVSCSQIWYAPNHLRAWKRETYDEAGGYNVGMRVLDDQDLIARTYLVTDFYHIDRCLYLYRIIKDKSTENTWLKHNAEIQANVIPIHNKYIADMAIKWSVVDNGLEALDLGGRFNHIPGTTSVDLVDADVCCDLNEVWPFEDNSVGVIIANDIFEHLREPLHAMKEAYRVLADGGMLLIHVPSTDGRGAYQDPTHISFWNQNSFWYYTRAQQAQFIDTPVRFQDVITDTYFPTAWHKENHIPYVLSHLIALKGDVRYPGILSI